MGADYSTEFKMGGSALAQLPPEVASDIIHEVLQARLFNVMDAPRVSRREPDRTLNSNSEFWREAGSGTLRETMVLHLPSCTVSEWMPRSPGRAFQRDSKLFVSDLPGARDGDCQPV